MPQSQSIASTWDLKPSPLAWSGPDRGEPFHCFQWALNQHNSVEEMSELGVYGNV